MTPAALAALHAACFETPRPWSEAEFAELLAGPENVFVQHKGGFALGRLILDECELLTLAVAPETRRQGIGRRLLAAFEAEAIARGARHAFLEVAAGNHAAIALYESCGYRLSGRRKAYYRDPDGTRTDALVLARHLA